MNNSEQKENTKYIDNKEQILSNEKEKNLLNKKRLRYTVIKNNL